ncbi:hypothetical protein QTO34_003044 [Cnephaeus nilssonii]|uniref:Uncharacterized protein n=1 Tax=Cnephaeus nilssonii TaxID=3371016 RepID=A0AA40HT81_CNENI|nr:hypothetical protein QTO34_003044 [Eptesicus nilssonii]
MTGGCCSGKEGAAARNSRGGGRCATLRARERAPAQLGGPDPAGGGNPPAAGHWPARGRRGPFGSAVCRPHRAGPAVSAWPVPDAPAAPSSRFANLTPSPTSENYALSLGLLSSGGAEAGEGGDRKGVGTSKDSPSLPRPPPPPQLGSRHVVPGVGGEEKRLDFLDARFASSSFSLRRQLRGRSAPPERAGDGSRERSREPRAGDAGAAGGTCGSSRRRRSPRRQQRGPPKLRQPPPRRPGQYPPRSPPRRHLPAPGPAAPGGCGSSASQRRFADCSCFKVRGEAGSPARGARRVHRRPLAPRAAQGLPRWSSAAAGAQRRREGKSPGRAPREESRRRVCRTRAADARCSDCTV